MAEAVAGVAAPYRPVEAAAAAARLQAVDLLRGLVIMLMALDHVRDFFHAGALQFDPLDFERTTPALYATRWITHFCAPTFVFLAGVSAVLQAARGRTRTELSWRLLTRGLWLVALELTVISFGWSFAPGFLFLQVIWAIGWSMVALAALVWLPRPLVLTLGLLILAGHNLLDPLQPQAFGPLAPLWVVLHEGGPFGFDGVRGFVAYPLLAWIGVMAAGYGAGPLFLRERRRRDPLLLLTGAALVLLFLALRASGLYGDPDAWAVQASPGRTAMDFLATTKYPPSLLYAAMTLGPALLALPVLERLKGPPARILLTFGCVPFFFYVLHIYLVHGLAVLAGAAMGVTAPSVKQLFTDPSLLQGWGWSLPVVYGVWLLALALLYPACRWFADIKRRRRDWWLSYL
jgi:uncharacterized membrane protein